MTMTFGLLGLAICAVWLPQVRIAKRACVQPWLLPFAAALLAGLAADILRWNAILALGVFGITAYAAGSSMASRRWQAVFYIPTALLALALALHLIPGFNNPPLVRNIQFSADAVPFTQYANFDKAAVGLILLAFLARRCRNLAEWSNMLRRILPIAVVTTAAVLATATAAGYVRPDFKLPWYAPVFLATNLLFVCVAEEAFFRGFLQDRLSRSLSRSRYGEPAAVLCSAALFGAAHLAGGPVYAGIAALAGLGYAYAYSVTKRIEAPILVHFGLNAVHFIGFTYPRLH